MAAASRGPSRHGEALPCSEPAAPKSAPGLRRPPSVSSPGRAGWATFAVFAANGFLFSSWVSRIPSVRDALKVDPAQLGLILLAMSTGAVIALPSAGPIVGRLGAARAVSVAAPMACLGMAVVALASAGPVALLAVGLFLVGTGYGVWDVSMNIAGVSVERALGRAVLPRFHAGFSLGTVLGALTGAGLDAVGVSPRAHLSVVALVLAVLTPWLSRALIADRAVEDTVGTPPGRVPSGVGRAWREPRTLLIGLLVLCFAFTEGTGNDWLAVATVDGYHRSNAFGSLVFGVFVTAMTVARLVGSPLLDRFGRVAVLRVSCVTAVIGVGFIVFGPAVAFAVIGAALWGAGASLGFPVGMSAAADDQARQSARVGVVSSVAYTAFLAGPPLVGFLGNHVGVRHALLVTAVLALIGLALSGSTRPEPVR